jgi:hypothetical protein
MFQPTASPLLNVVTSAGPSVSSPGLPPTLVLGTGTPFSVSLSATVTGLLTGLVTGSNWTFTVSAESIGAGYEGVLGSAVIVAPPGNPKVLSATVNCAPIAQPGTYMLTVAVTSTTGGIPNGIAGFETVMIQVANGV